MNRTSFQARLLTAVLLTASLSAVAADDLVVDFGYRPAQWRTAICPPDDPYKTLVNEKGALLYHFYQARPQEFGTEVSVVIDGSAKLTGQTLLSPRIPIVLTRFAADGLEILQEAFAVRKGGPAVYRAGYSVERMDRARIIRNAAQLSAGVAPRLATAAIDHRAPVYYRIKTPSGVAPLVALALCEYKHAKAGQRILELQVEGASSRRVDTVADLGKNVAGAFWFSARDANGDGFIDLKVAAAKEAADREAILNGFWMFDDATVPHDTVSLLAGGLDFRAVMALDIGRNDAESANDVILVHVTNTGLSLRQIGPKVVVRSAQNLELLNPDRVKVDFTETVISTLPTSALEKTKTERGEEAVMTLAPMTVAPGKTVSFAAVYCGGGRIEFTPSAIAQALQARRSVEASWKTPSIPFDRVTVPDPQIQALIDASIRNIWQAREIKNGLPAFMVGATFYRALFIVDGAFILEAANLVGAGRDTRAGIAYTLGNQQEDGRFELLADYYKENGIVLWTCVRHAQLTQDKPWLESIWPRIEKAVAYIQRLRGESRRDDSPLNDGLLPRGYPDGGIDGRHLEYTNVYWNLLGLKSIVQAAAWLGKTEQAKAWQAEFDDFYATFRKAALRDSRTDVYGNRYLPILMTIEDSVLLKDAEWYLPCKAQWGFCHGVYPGQLFDKDDPLVKGNLDMLRTYEKEGMVLTTGWLTGGIWNYFASFYGHALLWQGDGPKAAEVLYAFANHASPLLAWLEEQGLKDEPIRENGDMPHNWASAEFIRLAVHLLALDRGRELHLFEGLPAQWTKPGMVTKLKGTATPFGELTCSLRVAADGKSAALTVEPLSDPSCEKVVVHLGHWADPDAGATRDLDPKQRHEIVIPIASE